MTLPKIEYPINTITLGGKKHKFRPMLVRDEKILLTARESGNQNDIFTAILQVVNNCSLDDLDVESLPIFELEYAFLNLRISSIGNELELSYVDNEDGLEYKFKIDAEDIKIKNPNPEQNMSLEVAPGILMEMRYPPASLYSDKSFLDSNDAAKYFEGLLLASIKTIYRGEEAFDVTSVPKDELLAFIDDLDTAAYKSLQQFLENVPHMSYDIEYKNKNGTERKIALRTLTDFFIL